MYKLIIEDDEGKTTVVPLIRDEITIGRKEGNTIRLTERNVSRKHAKLVKQNGAIFIEDLTSYNGIKVNGDRISGRAPIQEGDRIQIGDYQLALKLEKPTQPGMPATEISSEKTTPFVRENGTGAPNAVMDLQPTVQTAILHAPSVPKAAETPARLVAVSSNFARQEFVLDKASMVIGRTDENDVVVNHRSISRHHAKIVREGTHYHIVDLQSANGVRVNGEEYGKVELRKGDHVDLGHVRLRFVAPGEDFVFDRDAQIVEVAGTEKSKAGMIALMAVVLIVVVAGGIALVKVIGKGGEKGSSGRSGDTEGQVARLLLEADKAMKSEDWPGAVAKCEEALKLDPSQELARDKRQRAEAEKKNLAAYNSFVQSAEKNDFDSAVASWGEVAEDSVYRQKGLDRYAKVRKSFINIHLAAARRAKAADKCEEARQHVEAVLTVDESNVDGTEIIRSCGAAAKPTQHNEAAPSKPVKEHIAAAPKVKEKEPKESSEAASEPKGDQVTADKVLLDARDAYVHGQYANAIEVAKKAVKAQPNQAWRLIGASSCFLKDRNGAVQAWNKLDTQGRSFLKYVCSRNGITVP
jgi:ABC transport system ATP-binding/permease protein